ncbi:MULTISPECIES: SDR family oxidoreductase [Mycobacterium avium complex (MAC)]|jgi:NAD(P)-dependent dehydrogenase (short-subunit alcohol dehydrogenase family)|uniref:SDR family oxidoreductase n=5 Tax=Mycobacterium avium complex (MAC) TaxID=120793 RepID=A0AAW5SCM6_MYCBC|nr:MULTISPECIES: SDR family oxidoreductase [Mycobacterium avium complex (MAC)]ETA92297.1 short-chain dehydrogenase [Mycobacterium avium 05-4293]ETB09378.1 short-chain dehydrogenase [Mycobacterium avium subsp. silvaticum ATCC 49884]ETB20863.1 short-chain dehydrogenase [Mycobacterium avium subsp. avium 11-4751]ETB24879.1 short-chain dehydrogenase [Mycobacterium avium 09-5983]ETB40960.1 short-chain dehydrogenase [Mycobacterium avium subsp. hominissuis 10-5606]ETB45944.1 short-chain dehydrogenase
MADTASIGLKVRDKVVVITGGARGIGLATATALHKLGAKVAIGDIDEVRVKESGAALDLDVYGKLDVTDPHSFSDFLDEVERQLGPIDVLVNNAGIMPLGRVVDESDAVTRRILDINVYGVILGSKLALARMIPRGRGHVINVASLAGETYLAGAATYCASKHAVVGFTDAARIEYRRSGVKFSVVKPTFVNTELIAGTSGAKGVRNAEPSDIADAIVKLVAHPRPRVRVTRTAGAIIASQKFMPRALSEGLNRLLGGEHVFTDAVDVEKRQAYEARARGEQ